MKIKVKIIVTKGEEKPLEYQRFVDVDDWGQVEEAVHGSTKHVRDSVTAFMEPD